MPLTDAQREQLSDVHRIPIGKVICLAKAAYDCYKCVKAAAGDGTKTVKCAEDLIVAIEKCMA